MASKWTPLPPTQLKYHPYQAAFWAARRARICKTCKLEFNSPEHPVCPQCGQPGLRKFHRLTLLSGRRGGKTEAGAIAAVEEACVPNTIGWCCAPTAPKLHRYILPALQKLIPAEWVQSWSSEYLDIRLKNGSLIHLQTLEDPDQGRGQGLDWVWVDEVCELTDEHWHVLRPSLTEKRGAAFFTSSPRSYDWVYDNFYAPAVDGRPGYWAARYATAENPIISKEELADAKATMPDTMYRQEYEADFVIFTGAVYPQFDQQILKTDDDVRKILPEWDGQHVAPWRQVYVGIDTGADHPFGGVKIVSSEWGLVVVGEYLERHRSFIEHAGSLKMLADSPNARYAINKNERQPIIELSQHGITAMGAENDVVAGTERVKTWLHNRQLWFVERHCPQTIKQMKAYRWADNKTKDGQARVQEKVYKRDDELPDCLRYICMVYPELPTRLVKDLSLRDLSTLPADMRNSIEAIRRAEGRDKPKEPPSIVGDFWA